MADKEVTKGQKIDAGPEQLDPGVEISDVDIDQAIGEEDPDFLKTLEGVGSDKSLSISQIVFTEGEQALNAEKDAWAQAGKMGRLIYRIFPFVPHLSLRARKTKIWFFDQIKGFKVRLKNFGYFLWTQTRIKVVGGGKKFIKERVEAIDESQRQFRYLPLKLKLFFMGILVLGGVTTFYIYRSLTHGVIPHPQGLFMTSLESVATEVYDYDPVTEVEPFYENLRASINMVLIPKMVVNLKRSSKSGENPMGAFEFYIEGMVPEVIIEVKDREIEMRDRMQRVVEEFSYDMADSGDGKRFISEKIKKELNGVLTKGKIKNVLIKTAIVKP